MAISALVAAAQLAAPGSAPAAGWQAPVDVAGPGSHLSIVAVGVDPDGNATVLWNRFTAGAETRTFATTRPLGGSWERSAADVSPGDREATMPRVAIDARGDAIAIWSDWVHAQATMVVRAARRPAGGRWSAPVRLGADGGWAFGPQVAVDADGNAIAIWAQIVEYGGAYVVRAASLPRGGAWSEPANLSDATASAARDPQVAIDADGDATAVWAVRPPGGEREIVQAKRRPAGGAWDADAIDLSNDASNAYGPQVAVGPEGETTVAWSSLDGAAFGVQAAHRAADGGWSGPVDVSADGAESVYPQVALAVDPQGVATAVWGSYEPGGYVLRASRRPAGGGAWDRPTDLTPPDGGTVPWSAPNPRLVVDREGNATATWRIAAGLDAFRLQAAHRPAAGAWSAPVGLSPVGAHWAAEMAADRHGYVTAVWVDEADTAVRSRVFDPVPPELRSAAVPLSGVVGRPVAMSVDAFDVWSPVHARWDFGDGASGSGVAVVHCYRTPGTRTIRVAVADGAGNTTTATRTIAIAPDPDILSATDGCAGAGPGPEPRQPPEPREPPEARQPPEPRHPPDPRPEPGPRPRPHPRPKVDSRPRPGAAPDLSGLRQSTARWRARGRPGSGLPIGTTFRFRLDRPAAVELAFAELAPGRRVRGRCAKPRTANRGKPRCTRTRPRGLLRLRGRAGSNIRVFRGRLRGRTLAPGRYRLRIVAHAGGRRSKPATIRFTIAR